MVQVMCMLIQGVTTMLNKEELLNKAIELALRDIVEQMEGGEYVSSGQLSFLNSLAKTSGIKPIKEAEQNVHGFELRTKIQDAVTADKRNTAHYKEA